MTLLTYLTYLTYLTFTSVQTYNKLSTCLTSLTDFTPLNVSLKYGQNSTKKGIQKRIDPTAGLRDVPGKGFPGYFYA